MIHDMDMEKFLVYVAVFTETENEFVVEFPDLEGCLTQGASLSEAFCKAQEALAIYYHENNGQLPEASSIQTIQDLYPRCIVLLVSVDLKNYLIKSLTPVKKTLTIPKWLNCMGEKYGVNFSKVLKNGLIAHLYTLKDLSEYDRKMLIE